jgi:hypothetical protein
MGTRGGRLKQLLLRLAGTFVHRDTRETAWAEPLLNRPRAGTKKRRRRLPCVFVRIQIHPREAISTTELYNHFELMKKGAGASPLFLELTPQNQNPSRGWVPATPGSQSCLLQGIEQIVCQ